MNSIKVDPGSYTCKIVPTSNTEITSNRENNYFQLNLFFLKKVHLTCLRKSHKIYIYLSSFPK